jgi:hypothetical protein
MTMFPAVFLAAWVLVLSPILLNVYQILADEQVQGRKLLCSNKSFANAPFIATYFSSNVAEVTKVCSVVIACVPGA